MSPGRPAMNPGTAEGTLSGQATDWGGDCMAGAPPELGCIVPQHWPAEIGLGTGQPSCMACVLACARAQASRHHGSNNLTSKAVKFASICSCRPSPACRHGCCDNAAAAEASATKLDSTCRPGQVQPGGQPAFWELTTFHPAGRSHALLAMPLSSCSILWGKVWPPDHHAHSILKSCIQPTVWPCTCRQ